MKRKSPPPVPWFRLRCAACGILAAAVWTGVLVSVPNLTPQAPAVAPALAHRDSAPQAAPPAAPVPVSVKNTVLIDPGHGGKDPGKVAGDHLEKTWTLRLAQALAEELRARGVAAELTREDDTSLPLEDRSALANREPRPAAFVSLHFNSGKPEATGIEVFYAWPKSPAAMLQLDTEHHLAAGITLHDDRGRMLAEALQRAACSATGSRDRGVKNDTSLAVLNRTLCPAVLLECGFLTNPAECENIRSPEWRQKLAAGLADSLQAWLKESGETANYGISYVSSAAVPVVAGEPPATAQVP